jgi:hypothetical protein
LKSFLIVVPAKRHTRSQITIHEEETNTDDPVTTCLPKVGPEASARFSLIHSPGNLIDN